MHFLFFFLRILQDEKKHNITKEAITIVLEIYFFQGKINKFNLKNKMTEIITGLHLNIINKKHYFLQDYIIIKMIKQSPKKLSILKCQKVKNSFKLMHFWILFLFFLCNNFWIDFFNYAYNLLVPQLYFYLPKKQTNLLY